jgi:hypothetical protein
MRLFGKFVVELNETPKRVLLLEATKNGSPECAALVGVRPRAI